MQEIKSGRQKFMRYNVLVVLFFFVLNSCVSQKPVEKWSFDGDNPLISDYFKKETKHSALDIHPQIINGIKGKAIKSGSETNIIVFNLLSSLNQVNDFTISFYFKGESFIFTSYPPTRYRIQLAYSQISILYPLKTANKTSTINIPLHGPGIASYDYLADGNWHHYTFSFKRNGEFEMWIDGNSDPVFKTILKDYQPPENNISDGFRTSGQLDEVEIFDVALGENYIKKHYTNTQKSNSKISLNNTLNLIKIQDDLEHRYYDKKDFAPGYPDYDIQATKQLKSFPSPRYSNKSPMLRNFPWFDITYLHREMTSADQKFGNVNPEVAVELTKELVTRWNYYIELPILRTDSLTALKRYTDSKEIYSALIKYANENPEIPVASVLIEAQGNARHLGMDHNGPYVTSQNLPDKYYLTDKNNKPIIYGNKKWLNPFTADEILEKDGLITAFYINQLGRHLKRKIEFFNENGEWFGHKWKDELLLQSPAVKAFREKYNMDNHAFNGWMSHRFDSVYKETILKHIPWKDAKFTFYNVSAYNKSYWPSFKERITTNSYFNNLPRSTPSFYPARPDNWRLAAGALNGYGTIAEGRLEEIELGVKYFAPFVNAGWNVEEKNIRPAQWLALLKAMVMLGADFFHVGYFNVTAGGGWPNGKGPNDPRGYIYQIAMASYAQAMGSYFMDFLDKGELLNPQKNAQTNIYSFRFKASQENHLVMVRKLGEKYLIYGSIQPYSNYYGNVSDERTTEIELDGKKIKFNIRRQGSIYVYIPGNSPKFIQIDGWHQKEHPFYWSKDYLVEAEMAENLNYSSSQIFTENINDNDFSAAITGVKLAKGQSLEYLISPVKAYSKLVLTIRTDADSKLLFEYGEKTGEVKVKSGKGWKTLEIEVEVPEKMGKLILKGLQGSVDIDKLIFK